MKYMNDISVTFHSMERSSKRFGLHGDRRNYMQIVSDVRSALRIDNFSGRELAYLRGLCAGDRCPVVIGRKCYIVSSDGWVITVLRLPDWFCVHPLRSGKETARHVRRYLRSRDLYGTDAA